MANKLIQRTAVKKASKTESERRRNLEKSENSRVYSTSISHGPAAEARYLRSLHPQIRDWLDDEALLGAELRKNLAPEKVTRGSCVYVVQDQPNTFKIGHAVDIGLRLSQMQVGNSTEIKLIMTISSSTPKEVESYLHHLYHWQRIRGEWFTLCFDQLKGLYKAGGDWSCLYSNPTFKSGEAG